jgi:hypothetical protein
MEWGLALVALALVGVGAVSQRLSGTPVTPAMLFVAFGLLVGPEVLDGIDLSSSSATVRTLAEATLALVLLPTHRASTSARCAVAWMSQCGCWGSACPLTIALARWRRPRSSAS